MRAWLLCLGLLLSGPAFADGEPLVVGDKAHVKLDTHAKRFVDAELKGPRYTPVVELTVLYVEGNEVRVRGTDDTYGWLPMDSLEVKTAGMDMSMEEVQKMLNELKLQGG
jgi:hypothetical protein